MTFWLVAHCLNQLRHHVLPNLRCHLHSHKYGILIVSNNIPVVYEFWGSFVCIVLKLWLLPFLLAV